MEIFDVSACESKIGYVFKDKMLLRKAFTHASYANEHGEEDNELLEFFGDSIMEFIVTEHLFFKGKGNEGTMTQARAEMVSKTPLNQAFFKLNLTEHILLGEGQKKNLKTQDKLYSSVYEAIVCAIYLDGGIAPCKRFVKKTLISVYETLCKQKAKECNSAIAKSQFQEYVQKNKLGDIEYKLVKKSGPDHSAEFTIDLYLNGKKLAQGKGSSIKTASAQSAQKALKKLKNK
ncbi:MAG: ribonuclease III [Clostridia bacterium]|nr:ribonuclease III [Clostridia bacterium]